MKTDNYIKGRYLAEITRELMDDLTEYKYSHCEWRVSVYGRKKEEWNNLATWACNNKLFHPNVRWMVQTPRLYNIYRNAGIPGINSFADLIRNIFEPLFAVTIDPSSNPNLHW